MRQACHPERLFIGITLGDAARTACVEVAERLRASGVTARYVDPRNYHLTLAFLGNVDADRISSIISAIDAIAARYTPFDLSFDRIGAFPNERRPRVVFVGSRGSSLNYRALTEDVRRACGTLGFTVENDAIPHITIARTTKSDRGPLPMLDVAEFSTRVGELTLFESLPHEGATRYVTRHSSNLEKDLLAEHPQSRKL